MGENTGTPRISTNPMGHVLWSFPGMDYIWYGKGSPLFLVLTHLVSPILHPAACGVYDTKKDARKALDAFRAAVVKARSLLRWPVREIPAVDSRNQDNSGVPSPLWNSNWGS